MVVGRLSHPPMQTVVLRLPSTCQVPLRFPGARMNVSVPSGTCVEMFATGADGSDVVYIVGPVSFAVKETVVPSDSFLGMQLRSPMRAGIASDGGRTEVCLGVGHDPCLFPILFDFLNRRFCSPLAIVCIDGLSDEECKAVDTLIRGYMLVDAPPVTSTLHLMQRGRMAFVGRASGLLCPGVRAIACQVTPDYIVCVSGDSTVRINIGMIPTMPPWPPSLVKDLIAAMMPEQGVRASKRPCVGTRSSFVLEGDELDESGDFEIPQYPYDVDFKRSFFIPAVAISCIIEGNRVVCEGVFDCVKGTVRVDALATKSHAWVWLQVELKRVQ